MPHQVPSRRIRFLVAGIIVLVVALLVYGYWCRPTEVLLVRHADRQGQSDALSADGFARAQELARVLKKSGIRAIYTSEATRTQQTASPTAALLGLTPSVIQASDVAGLVSAIRTQHAGQKVLVVGHSNTLPQIIAALGGPSVTINSDEYGTLYRLTLRRCGARRVALTTLQYGAASP